MADPFIERSFAHMVEKVSDYAIFLLDRTGLIRTWNPAAEAMKGYLKSEALGRHFGMLYTEEDQRRNHPAHNLEHAARHDTFQESAWRQRKDGSLFWALVEIIAIRNDSGELEGYCKLTRDLTNLKELQDRLAAEKARAELTLSAIADGVISVDAAGLVDYMNDQARALTGWPGEEAKGLGIDQVFDITGQDDAGDVSARTTSVLRARDGSRHMIDTRRSPIPCEDGRPCGTVIVFHDVSERERMEAALRDAGRRKDEFLAMLAHELRNPLAPVSAAAELLALGKLEAGPARKASQVIIRQVKHMTALVDDLLDVSRVSRGQITLRLDSLDMKISAVEQARPLIENRGHTLAVKLAPDKAYVKGDEKRLIQIVANLLNNAAKYTPPGGNIDVELYITENDVCIDVSDNGIGIEPAAQQAVFELFEQVQQTSDRTEGGLGIGLSLVRSLVRLHGGTASCHSEGLGCGSRFTVCIPRLGPEEAVPDRRVADRLADLQPVHSGLSVLLVDDNVDAADMLHYFLSTMGHQVTLAHTAAAALEAIGTLMPDVCILDIGLPDSSGHELAMNIRKRSSAQPVLIALTGYGMSQDRDQATEAGFDHYFIKPADLDALVKVLAEIRPRATI